MWLEASVSCTYLSVWAITDPILTTQMHFETDVSSMNNVIHVWQFQPGMCTAPKWVVVSANHWIIFKVEWHAKQWRVYSEVKQSVLGQYLLLFWWLSCPWGIRGLDVRDAFGIDSVLYTVFTKSCRINSSCCTCDAKPECVCLCVYVCAGPVWNIPRQLHLQPANGFLH